MSKGISFLTDATHMIMSYAYRHHCGTCEWCSKMSDFTMIEDTAAAPAHLSHWMCGTVRVELLHHRHGGRVPNLQTVTWRHQPRDVLHSNGCREKKKVDSCQARDTTEFDTNNTCFTSRKNSTGENSGKNNHEIPLCCTLKCCFGNFVTFYD